MLALAVPTSNTPHPYLFILNHAMCSWTPCAWGRGEDLGCEDSCFSAACLHCWVLAGPTAPVASAGAMAPSPVPAGQWGRQPGAWYNKHSSWKVLARDQFPAHCSCSQRSWGHLTWAAGLTGQDQRSFALGLSPAMGTGEKHWSSPGQPPPPQGACSLSPVFAGEGTKPLCASGAGWGYRIWSDPCCNHHQNNLQALFPGSSL